MSQVAAMKQALEALGKIEEHGNVPGWCEFDTNEDAVNYHEAFNKGMKASTALRAAIAEQEKCEPVATVKIVEHLPDELEMLAVFHPPFAVSDGTKLFTHPAPVPAGMVLVPVEPTETMQDEWLANYSFKDAYKAMLAASPKPGEMK